jgi:type IV secretory pathway protease TraF
MFQKLNTREKTIAVVFLAALLTGLWLPTRIIVSTSDSLDHRIFFMVGHDREQIKDGDYLVFRQDGSPFIRQDLGNNEHLFTKQVGCSPGERLRRDVYSRFFCERTPLGKALTQDSKGRDLPQFSFNGPVPENHFFMVGTHPRSFDSKYFGFIHADEITYKALPLW